jgi:hypothetical protein
MLIRAARTGLVVVAAFATGGCVIGSAAPPSRLEVARAPLGPHGRGTPSTTSLSSPGCNVRTETRPPRPAADAVWIDGSCHWDGNSYRWIEGRWERRLMR